MVKPEIKFNLKQIVFMNLDVNYLPKEQKKKRIEKSIKEVIFVKWRFCFKFLSAGGY